MRSRPLLLASLPLLILPGAGCGTISDLGGASEKHEAARIYGGIRNDVALIEGPNHPHVAGIAEMIGILDFPFSLALDTAVLPITLTVALVRELSSDPSAPYSPQPPKHE